MKLSQSIALLATGILVFTLAGCEKEGPAEQAGEQIDEAVETMQDKADDAGDKAMDELEEAGDKIEEATDSATQ